VVATPPARSVHVKAAVDDRSDEPAVDVRWQPSLLPEAQQRLLHGIVRQVVAPQDPPRQPLEPGEAGHDGLGVLVSPGMAPRRSRRFGPTIASPALEGPSLRPGGDLVEAESLAVGFETLR
jgi:hypothetical protein